ncbi:hypothetical protein [Glutamicibacter sp. AOP5-A2-18]|uniref:hypothetical protein n=1 Tax=Glutamicibacter sp. AOP5-A2-18 TaxID=3457656 RepID=UPI004034C448
MTDHFTELSLPQQAHNDAVPAPLRRSGWSFAILIFAAQMLVVFLVVIGMAISTYQQQARVILDDKQATVATISITLANDPFVINALAGKNPAEELQPYTKKILDRGQGVDFISIMTPDTVRVTHPDPNRIGQKYAGST